VSNYDTNILDLMRRVAELERQVAHLYAHGSVPAPPPAPAGSDVSDEVRRLVAEGNLIAAIKQHRQDTGLGLAEAKGRIDELVAGR